MLYTLNLYSAACQLYLNKTGRKKWILLVLVLHSGSQYFNVSFSPHYKPGEKQILYLTTIHILLWKIKYGHIFFISPPIKRWNFYNLCIWTGLMTLANRMGQKSWCVSSEAYVSKGLTVSAFTLLVYFYYHDRKPRLNHGMVRDDVERKAQQNRQQQGPRHLTEAMLDSLAIAELTNYFSHMSDSR